MKRFETYQEAHEYAKLRAKVTKVEAILQRDGEFFLVRDFDDEITPFDVPGNCLWEGAVEYGIEKELERLKRQGS